MNLNERKKMSFTIADIANEAVKLFELKNPPSDNEKDNYRQKIKAEAKKIYNQENVSLFEQATFYYDKKSGNELTIEEKEKKEKKEITAKCFFTKEQMTELLFSAPLFNYFKDRSESYEMRCLQSAQELNEEAQELNRKYRQFLVENHVPDSPAPLVTEAELSDKVKEIMLDAIFQRYFEPLNVSKLFEDMNLVRNSYNGNHSIFSLYAENRLKNARNYYQTKKEGALQYVNKCIDSNNEQQKDQEIYDYIKKNCTPASNSSIQKIHKHVRDYYKAYYIKKLKNYLEEYYNRI